MSAYISGIINSLSSINLTKLRESMRPQKPMKYPYTWSAKIVQFPYIFYFKNNWMYRHYPFGILVTMPLFWYFSSLSNSRENKKIWKEKRRKEKEGHH